MKIDTLQAIAHILGNGYKCFVNLETEEVFSAEDLPLAQQKSIKFKSYVPLEGKLTFAMMEEFTAQVDDFGDQSALMETLTFEQPFYNFKKKVYQLRLADDWITFRTQKIINHLTV